MTAASCSRSLSEHDPNDTASTLGYAKALEARRAGAQAWSALIRRDEGLNGWRDYLDGEAVHCGTGLELQAVQYVDDEDGSYMVRLPAGVPVRYERSGDASGEYVVLYADDIGGHTFMCRAQPWMRFRWPRRG